MTMDRQAAIARAIAWAIAVVAAIALVLALWLLSQSASSSDPISILFVGLFAGLGIVGSLIVRRAQNQIGWVFLAIGTSLTLAGLAGALTDLSTLHTVPWVEWWSWWNDTGFVTTMFALPFLFLLFPDGHLPSPRWRWVVRVYALGVAISLVWLLTGQVSHGLYRNPTYVPWSPLVYELLLNVGGALAFGAAFASIVALIVRYRRSSGEIRLQMRWVVADVAFGAAWLILAIVAKLLPVPVSLQESISDVAFTVMYLTVGIGLPVAVTLAVFRYRLYDIDLVIRKTVVFGLLAVFITVVYAGVVGLISTRFERAGSFIAAATLAILFAPARERARRVADRLVYGKRATPYEVLAEFSGRLGEAYADDDVLSRMAEVLKEGTGAAGARVLLRVGNEPREAAAVGENGPGETVVDVRHHGEDLGALAVTMPAADPMDPAKRQLVDGLAAQAGLVLRNVKLIEELKASRQRLVAAQDEERRRLERNLHDGAQQQLVALAVKQRLLGSLIGRDDDKARAMVTQLSEDANEALENLRDLARGIYPPLLQDKGLVPALEAQARKAAVLTSVEGEGIGRFGQDVEAAVYFSCLEALQNVAKYAEASRATIALTNGDGTLTFTVTDDGEGFDRASTGYGTGLQGIADRLAALDGTLDVLSQPGTGTTLMGRVPIEGAR